MDTPEKEIDKAMLKQIARITLAIGRKSAREVAREVGLHENTVCSVLNYRHKPSRKTLRALTEKYL